MRMAGDAERALAPDLFQDVLGRLVGADELADVQRDDVRVLLAADVVLRDLRARESRAYRKAASPARASTSMSARYASNRSSVTENCRRPSVARRAGAGQQIAFHQDVIGDRDDVEPPGLAVQVDHFTDG